MSIIPVNGNYINFLTVYVLISITRNIEIRYTLNLAKLTCYTIIWFLSFAIHPFNVKSTEAALSSLTVLVTSIKVHKYSQQIMPKSICWLLNTTEVQQKCKLF